MPQFTTRWLEARLLTPHKAPQAKARQGGKPAPRIFQETNPLYIDLVFSPTVAKTHGSRALRRSLRLAGFSLACCGLRPPHPFHNLHEMWPAQEEYAFGHSHPHIMLAPGMDIQRHAALAEI